MESIKSVIITGADGYVGSHTTEYFLQQGVSVLAIDINDIPNNLKQHPLLRYEKLNIFENDQLMSRLSKNTYDAWIHFAWMGSAGEGRKDINLQLKNAMACLECLKIAKGIGCRRFVGAGSIIEKEVTEAFKNGYGTPNPAYQYGIGKLMAHYWCKIAAGQEGINLVWPCITNCFGAGEKSPRFINTTLRKSLNNEPLIFSPATQNYDFVYVDDVARAFYLCTLYGKDGNEYMIGSGQAKPLKEFISTMLETIHYKGRPEFSLQNVTGVNLPIEVFDTKELERDTGYRAEVSFKEGIIRTYDGICLENS